MNLCSDDHEEVCYEGRNCPACEVRTDLRSEVKDLERKVDDLENQIQEINERDD
jgi:hypothetical protein